MATYSRVKTWSSNETLTSSDLNAEFNNIITNTNSGALNSDNVSTTAAWSWTGTHTMSTSSKLALIDNIYLTLGSATDGDYFLRYSASNTALELSTTNSDGSGTNAVVLDIQDGTDDVRVRGGLSTDNNAAPTTGLKVGGNIISDTDSTDDLGTTSVRWANVYTDAVGDSGQTLGVKATTLSFDAAATIDTSGNNNLTLNAGTGTLVVTGAATTTGNVGIGNADIGTTYHAGNLLLVGDEHADTGDTSTAIVIATRVAGTGELNFTDSPTTAQQGSIWYDHNVDAMILRANTGEKMRIDSAGAAYIGDTANSFSTIGVTINQEANNDEVLALKSSSVAHDITGKTQTDTYGLFQKFAGTTGGLQIGSYTESNVSMFFQSVVTSVDTTKSTSGVGAFMVQGALKSGTGITALSANANIVAFGLDGGTTRFLFDTEGSGHADVEWTTFDQHDDIALLHDIEATLVPDTFGAAMKYDAAALTKVGILGKDSLHSEKPGTTRGMINFTKLSMLHHGAIRQVHQQLQDVKEFYQDKIAALESRLLRLEA